MKSQIGQIVVEFTHLNCFLMVKQCTIMWFICIQLLNQSLKPTQEH